MTLRFAWLLPFLAVGCALGSNDSPQAQCERQAYDDPTVKQVYGDTAFTYNQSGRDKLAEAIRQATLECLRRKGLAPPGGVEPVQRSYY